MGYISFVKTIIQTEIYRSWFAGLRDVQVRARVDARIRRAQLGNFGDVEPVGEGVSEMRIHFGAGYRLYFVQRAEEVIVLLAGGDKSTQVKDIKLALSLAREIRKEQP